MHRWKMMKNLNCRTRTRLSLQLAVNVRYLYRSYFNIRRFFRDNAEMPRCCPFINIFPRAKSSNFRKRNLWKSCLQNCSHCATRKFHLTSKLKYSFDLNVSTVLPKLNNQGQALFLLKIFHVKIALNASIRQISKINNLFFVFASSFVLFCLLSLSCFFLSIFALFFFVFVRSFYCHSSLRARVVCVITCLTDFVLS